MPIPEATVDEITSTIKRSNLFNVIVEGRDDIVAFRVLERKLHLAGYQNVSLISAGGRTKLLDIYRNLVDDPSLSRCVFICDKDLWVFSGVPEEFDCAELIKTDGYSIENDLLRDYPPQQFMNADELLEFSNEFLYFTQWYSLETFKVLAGRPGEIGKYPGIIIDGDQEDYLIEIVKAPDLEALYLSIEADKERLVRGKSFMQVVLRQLAKAGRPNRHRHLDFLEHSAVASGVHFSRIVSAVEVRVNAIA
ncbi:hypothetical protein [Ascidiaceihabitans sp.]|uniref:hypothetical protein n=1 Tax=Ascidiaceihabitans sp. TaxID=1872644 RepID=UPI003299795D